MTPLLRTLKATFWILFGAFIAFGLVLLGSEKMALLLAPSHKLGYFLKYSTLVGSSGEWKVATWRQVFVDRRPHDCEWGTAPLGSKHCHYDPIVRTVRTVLSKNGQLMISYDEGKTSQPANSADEEPAIYVNWERENE